MGAGRRRRLGELAGLSLHSSAVLRHHARRRRWYLRDRHDLGIAGAADARALSGAGDADARRGVPDPGYGHQLSGRRAGFLGQVGPSGNDRINMARPVFASSDSGYFLFVAAITVLCIFLVEAHRRSKPGRAWR